MRFQFSVAKIILVLFVIGVLPASWEATAAIREAQDTNNALAPISVGSANAHTPPRKVTAGYGRLRHHGNGSFTKRRGCASTHKKHNRCQHRRTRPIGLEPETETPVSSSMATPFVPVDTAATVQGQPGIALGYHPAQENARPPEGDSEAFFPLGSGNALQIVVLDRQTLQEVDTWNGPANSQSLSDAVELLKSYDDSKLVLMTAWADPKWKDLPEPSYNFTSAEGPAGLIGADQVPLLTEEVFGPLENGQMSFIGVPGFPAGTAWGVWGLPQDGANDLTSLDGFLTPDNYLNYVYLGTAPQGFDLGPDGQSVSLSIGDSTYTASLSDGEGGFTVVYLNGKTLEPWPYDSPSKVTVQETYQTRNTDGSPNLDEMQRMSNDLEMVSSDFMPPMFVAIRSIGSQPLAPIGGGKDQSYVDALNDLVTSVGDVGGLGQWIYGMATQPKAQNSYSLIGGNVSVLEGVIDIPGSGEGLGTDAGTAASPTPPSTQLSGLLIRRKDQGYEVRGAANSSANPMSPVLAQLIADEPVEWPYAGSRSLQCIGNYLNFGPDLRAAYWREPLEHKWGNDLIAVEGMTVSDCKQFDPHYKLSNYSDFGAVQKEIKTELPWVEDVKGYIESISQPFSGSGLSSYADLQQLTDTIKDAVTPPPTASTGISIWSILSDLANIVAGFDVPGAGLVASVISFGHDTYAAGQDGPTSNYRDKIQAEADEIGEKLAQELTDAVANGEHVFDIIVADYNKLRTVALKAGCLSEDASADCPPEWQFTQNQQIRASEVYLINAQRVIWGGLMAAAYPYVLMTNSNPSTYDGTFVGPQDQISSIGCDYAEAFAIYSGDDIKALEPPQFLNYGIPQVNNYLFLVYSQTNFKGNPKDSQTNFPPASLFTPSKLPHPFEAIDPFDTTKGLGMDEYQFMVENWQRGESDQPPLRKNWLGCGG